MTNVDDVAQAMWDSEREGSWEHAGWDNQKRYRKLAEVAINALPHGEDAYLEDEGFTEEWAVEVKLNDRTKRHPMVEEQTARRNFEIWKSKGYDVERIVSRWVSEWQPRQ